MGVQLFIGRGLRFKHFRYRILRLAFVHSALRSHQLGTGE